MNLLWNRAKVYGALFSGMLTVGCIHQQPAPPLAPQAKTPNIYVPPPDNAKLPPMQTEETPPNLTDAKPVEAAEVKPKKKVKRASAPPAVATAPPVPIPAPVDASAAAPATLGALAPGGGNANPKQQQEVMTKISSVEKRVADLPSSTAEREQKQIAKVKQFLNEASDALKGGDAEGALILATKADLLMGRFGQVDQFNDRSAFARGLELRSDLSSANCGLHLPIAKSQFRDRGGHLPIQGLTRPVRVNSGARSKSR